MRLMIEIWSNICKIVNTYYNKVLLITEDPITGRDITIENSNILYGMCRDCIITTIMQSPIKIGLNHELTRIIKEKYPWIDIEIDTLIISIVNPSQEEEEITIVCIR